MSGPDPSRTARGPWWPVSRAPAARAPSAGSPGLAPLRAPAAAARRAPGGRGRAVRAGVRAERGQEIPDRRPRPSAVRHPPRARALHPKTCVPDGRMRLRPAALAVSEPLVLRASWGPRLAARTYGVRAARLRTFLGAPARMPGHMPRRLCDMSISGTSGAAAAPRRELRRRSVALKIVRGMRRRTAPVTACIRARAWTLEQLQSRARSRTMCRHRNR